jgi:hypothetical protein
MPEMMRQISLSLAAPDVWTQGSGPMDSPIMLETKEKWKKLQDLIGQFGAYLESLPELVQDIGRTNFEELDLLGWGSEWVESPSLGYARKYKYMNAQTGIEKADGLLITSPCSEFNIRLALTLMLLDLGRYGPDLLPKPVPVDGFDPRDQPWGVYLSGEEQLLQIRGLFILYLIQGTIFSAHVNKRLNDRRFELGYALDNRVHAEMDAWRANQEYVLSEAQLPMHPLLSYVAHALQSGTIKTYYGDRDILYRWGAREDAAALKKENGDKKIEIPDGIKSEMGKQMIEAAMADMHLLRRQRDNGEKGAKWGDCYRPSPVPAAGEQPPDDDNGGAARRYSPDNVNNEPMTYGTFVRQMKSLGRVFPFIKEYAGKLGWTTLRGDVGQIDQAAADFIASDGETYSASATAAALGLRPVISLGNAKVSGFKKRMEYTWNGGDGTAVQPEDAGLFLYSTINVDGFQGDTKSREMLSRFYMPAGMSMGGKFADFFFTYTGTDDPLGQEAISWYTDVARDAQYVTMWYQDPIEGIKKPFNYTSWDGWSYGKRKTAVEEAYQKAYVEQMKPLAESGFLLADGHFQWRLPVQMTRPNYIEMYDMNGTFTYVFGYDGGILFGGDVTLSVTSADLEAIVQTNPRDIAERQLAHIKPSETSDQIKGPSETT